MRYSDYAKVRDIAHKYYGDTNCCTVIALAVAAGCGYGKAYHVYRRLGRKTRRGTYMPMQVSALAEMGLEMVKVPAPVSTVNQAEKLLRGTKGIYMVYSTSHVSAVYDGIMHDWASGGSRKRVTGIYKVVPKQ